MCVLLSQGLFILLGAEKRMTDGSDVGSNAVQAGNLVSRIDIFVFIRLSFFVCSGASEGSRLRDQVARSRLFGANSALLSLVVQVLPTVFHQACEEPLALELGG